MVLKRVVSAFALFAVLGYCQPLLAQSARPQQNDLEAALNRMGKEAMARMQALRAKGPLPPSLGILEKGHPARAIEKDLCFVDDTDLCLLGRFDVFGVWDNPFADPNAMFNAGALQLTTESGYLWFQDLLDMEIPIKILNFCDQGVFKVFAAGLTDFGVGIGVLDFVSGTQVNYINPDFNTFNTIIDEAPPFPCP
jgi:hypothetical protein